MKEEAIKSSVHVNTVVTLMQLEIYNWHIISEYNSTSNQVTANMET